jgi:exopolyphosphatase/guanosine-5'-triphosphate,3'-diphosphate pyrophosphatase
MKELDIQHIQVTDLSMQHGLLVDYMMKNGYLQRSEPGSFRLENVQRFARKLQVDLPHAEKVRALAVSMFDSAKRAGFHKIDAPHRELMEYAALLHDVGIFLSYSNHEAHSYYLIKNAGLEGFDQDELQTIATLAYFHRKRFPQDKHAEFSALQDRERKAVRQISVLLRIAETLDRSHTGVVKTALIRRRGEDAVLEVLCSQSAELEMWGLEAHNRAFERAFNTSLTAKMILQR